MAEHHLNNNIHVDLNRVPSERCSCGSSTWTVVYIIKKLSALVSPNGKETIVPVQVFACTKCGKISPLYKNLNDTDEISSSEGASLGNAVNEVSEKPRDSAKLYI